MRIIKMHIGLYRYIKQEYKKAPNKLKFWKGIISAYFIAWKNELKLLLKMFDKDYRKQKKDYKKYQVIQKDLTNALKLLQYKEKLMEQKGFNRQEIRQYWLDFTKNGKVRSDLFEELMKNINSWRK